MTSHTAKGLFSSLFILLFFSTGLAQIELDVSWQDNEVIFKGNRLIRYEIDRATQTITIPDGQLNDLSITFPPGYKVVQREDGLGVMVGGPFTAALSTDELTLTVRRGEIRGAQPAPVLDDERSPTLYRLSNAEPSQVATLLKSMYSSLVIEVDERQRALLIMVNPEDQELIDEVVKAIDREMPQVVFEAEILEINQNVTKSLGINYDTLFTFSLQEDAPKGIFAMGELTRNSPFSLTIGINLLKANGAAEVLARPRITALDGVQAQLNATQSFPVLVNSSNGQESVQNITTGIQLTMLPKINPDGFIEADISISVSTPTGITSQKVPTFSSREASTTVRVANGEQIVIGGLYEKRRLEGKQKVPILGDIPLLGALFTSSSVEERETDLVIVVTPRIVDTPGPDSVTLQNETGQ